MEAILIDIHIMWFKGENAEIKTKITIITLYSSEPLL